MTSIVSEKEYLNCVKDFNGKTIIFGVGKYGKLLLSWCRQNGVDICAFCVTNEENNVSSIEGIRVISFDESIENKDNYLFLIGVENHLPIERKLKEKDIKEYMEFPDWLCEYDEISI